jgi:hypothetical protein
MKIDKKKLIAAARIAKQVPGEKPFWRDVEKRMNVREKSLVTKREIRH